MDLEIHASVACMGLDDYMIRNALSEKKICIRNKP